MGRFMFPFKEQILIPLSQLIPPSCPKKQKQTKNRVERNVSAVQIDIRIHLISVSNKY